MDVGVTSDPAIFDDPRWREVHEADSHGHIFSTPEWHRSWWREFGEGKQLFVLTFLDPEPVGFSPLMLDETDQGRRLRFVGGDDLTDYLGPICKTHDHFPPIADALIDYLTRELDGWDYFDAKGLPVPFHFAEWLVEAADRHGLDYSVEQHEVSAVMELPASFDDYLSGLSRKKRHELRRKMRRFEQEAPGAEVVSASENTLQADVRAFIDMHGFSEGNKGRFMLPSRATFFARLAETFGALKLLELDFLEVAGERIASTFGFNYRDRFYLYNSAYDTAYRKVSPGLYLVAKLIERSIERGLDVFDFLKGRERYKFDLGAEQLPLHAVHLRR